MLRSEMVNIFLCMALCHSYRATAEIAFFAFVFDAKNDTEMLFYQRYDFVAAHGARLLPHHRTPVGR